MKQGIFKSVAHEQLHNRQVQKFKFNFTYHVTANVAPSTTTPVILTIDQDADFLIEKITGSAYGPVDADGVVQAAGATDFRMPGTTTGFAGRGMTVKITDTGSGRDLTSGFVPVELLLSPGYGRQFYTPYPIKYFALRNSKLRFDFRNRDSQASARQQIDIALNGFKYQMPEIRSTLDINEGVSEASPVAS